MQRNNLKLCVTLRALRDIKNNKVSRKDREARKE